MQIKMTTSLGDIKLELFEDVAPETVKNFLRYVREGFYNGTVFHRVIDGFMIQGGGFTAEFKEKRAHEPIRNEADNRVSNERGTIAMARTSAPHSASCQFFINVKDNGFLDHTMPTPSGWGYCVFGKVVEGMDTVDKIRKVATGSHGMYDDVPKTPVVIESVVMVS